MIVCDAWVAYFALCGQLELTPETLATSKLEHRILLGAYENLSDDDRVKEVHDLICSPNPALVVIYETPSQGQVASTIGEFDCRDRFKALFTLAVTMEANVLLRHDPEFPASDEARLARRLGLQVEMLVDDPAAVASEMAQASEDHPFRMREHPRSDARRPRFRLEPARDLARHS